MKIILIFVLIVNQVFSQSHYVIKNVVNLNAEMFINAREVSTSNCRKSVSGEKMILKFESETPEIFKDDIIYTNNEITQELKTEEWTGYTGGIASIGKFFITDFDHRNDLNMKISDWMYIKPVRIKDNLWAIPYDVYVKYKTEVDNNIDLFKCVIRNVKKNELIEVEF